MNQYKTPLCACCNDLGICIYGFCCPCCLNANNLAVLRSENCGFYHCLFPFSAFHIRQIIKEKRKITIDPCDDCLIICCCYYCAICQDARELKEQLEYI